MRYIKNYNYKNRPRITREQRLKEHGREFYCNEDEDLFAVLMSGLGISTTKRGHPDFIVFNSDGTIYGFVEVKNKDEKFLKDSQKIYSIFCHKYGIPFLKWTPDTTSEDVEGFLKDRY